MPEIVVDSGGARDGLREESYLFLVPAQPVGKTPSLLSFGVDGGVGFGVALAEFGFIVMLIP